MAPQHWQEIKEILGEALEREKGTARTRFVTERCGEDTTLRREIETYLDISDQNVEACAENIRSSVLAKMGSQSIGRRVGAYRIVQEIGRGGMGAVYLAARADGQFDKQVAIKILKRGTDTDEVVRRFGAERQILAQLEHQSIARLLDAGTTEDGLPYFVMEYVAGEPITHFVQRRKLSIRQRLELFLKVCAAVERAHRDRIVHRDLKPSNILVTFDGEPKLLDFGIAKLLEPSGSTVEATATNQQRLTPACASPEQARGDPVTVASDIHALGALLYEILTEQKPHQFSTTRPSSEELTRVICEEEPIAPSMAASDRETQRQLKGDLDNIVMLAMRKEPERRYPSVGEFAEDVRRYLNAQPIEAAPGPTIYRGRGSSPRSRRLALRAGLSLAAALVSVLAIVFSVGHRSPHRAGQPSISSASIRSIAILPFEPLARNGQDELLGLGMADAIIGRLSGLKELVVLPTAAVSRFKGSTDDAIAAGRDLRVDAIICGTVQRSSDQVRVTVQLVNVGTRQTLWATTFNQTFTDIFAIQDSISQDVARSLAVNLSREDRNQLATHNTSSTAAYDLYLLGLSSYNQRTKDGLANAVTFFQKAIEKDPNYALAYALLADCYCLQGYYKFRPSTETYPLARAAAEQAVRLDSSLAEGYLALAMVQPMPDPKKEVERLLRRAIELNPNLALAHQRYAWRLCASGDLERALSEMKLAQELDPLSATNSTALGIVYAFARQFEPALRYCERAATLNPNEPLIQSNLGNVYILVERFPEAIARFQRAIDLAPESKGDNLASIALAWLRAGNIREADQLMPEVLGLAAQGEVDPYNLALIYGARGDKDEAFKWFIRCLERKDAAPGLIRFDALLDPLRSDARFNELLLKYERNDLVASKSE